MKVFGKYSHYYNLLYKDKDYIGEADYVRMLIRKYHANAKTILDLGCGTGRHDLLLAEKGYEVTGVDMSEEMLAVAKAHAEAETAPHPALSLDFRQGDIREVRCGKTFDVVLSLFHVVSYQTTNDSLAATFATAKTHLNPNGVFIFDCWYGPAVLTERPVVRIKRLEDREIAVTRIAEPVMHANENVVDVNYHVFVREKSSGNVKELKETHQMRYLFRPEIELLLREAKMNVVEALEWMTGRNPGFDTWGVCFVVR
jgi:SAM-dependent methyltransferase